jgi:hypothetical protein
MRDFTPRRGEDLTPRRKDAKILELERKRSFAEPLIEPCAFTQNSAQPGPDFGSSNPKTFAVLSSRIVQFSEDSSRVRPYADTPRPGWLWLRLRRAKSLRLSVRSLFAPWREIPPRVLACGPFYWRRGVTSNSAAMRTAS